MSKAEILGMLNGCEVMSIMHEGVVLIEGEYGFVDGKKFKITKKVAEDLWESYKYENESFGLYNY